MADTMGELNRQIKRIRKQYQPEELRRIFTERLDDEMFRELALMENGYWGRPDFEAHIAVWRGFELASGTESGGQKDD